MATFSPLQSPFLFLSFFFSILFTSNIVHHKISDPIRLTILYSSVCWLDEFNSEEGRRGNVVAVDKWGLLVVQVRELDDVSGEEGEELRFRFGAKVFEMSRVASVEDAVGDRGKQPGRPRWRELEEARQNWQKKWPNFHRQPHLHTQTRSQSLYIFFSNNSSILNTAHPIRSIIYDV